MRSKKEKAQHDIPTFHASPTRIRDRFATNESGLCWPHEKRSRVMSLLCISILSIMLLGVIGRVGQLQHAPSKQISQRLNTQHSKTKLLARRGNMTDRQGRIFASTHIAYRLFVDPMLVEDFNSFSETIGYAIGLDPAQIDRAIHKALTKNHRNRYVVIQNNSPTNSSKSLTPLSKTQSSLG